MIADGIFRTVSMRITFFVKRCSVAYTGTWIALGTKLLGTLEIFTSRTVARKNCSSH